jgi:ABC-type transporter Mla subunit MlaD|tara:strand:+ start:2578 stop:3102 length:525 start_codon:yes stop_codon:yes gene_type:complete
MNAKEKFIFLILGALIIGAFYFQYLTDEVNNRMDGLDLADKEHVDKVLNEFSDSLRVYNLRFQGRGKHLRKAQKDIVANTDLIDKNTDSLATMIDNVDFKLDGFMRDTDKKFRNVTNDLDDLATDIKGTVRKLKQGISDLEQTAKTLDKRLKEIEDLTLIQEEKAEAAEAEEDD